MVDQRKRGALRLIAFLLVSAALFALTACEAVPKDISFKNELNVSVNIYFGRSDDDEWNDKPTAENIRSGGEIAFGFSKLDSASGKKFDIGAIDENSINYDVYDVVLVSGDTVTLSGDAGGAKFTITHSDGTKTELPALIKENAG